MQYTAALCAFPGVNCAITHLSGNAAQGAVKGLRAELLRPEGLVCTPLQCLALLRGVRGRGHFLPKDLGRGPEKPTVSSLEGKERSQHWLAVPKAYRKQVTSWLQDFSSS